MLSAQRSQKSILWPYSTPLFNIKQRCLSCCVHPFCFRHNCVLKSLIDTERGGACKVSSALGGFAQFSRSSCWHEMRSKHTVYAFAHKRFEQGFLNMKYSWYNRGLPNT